MKNRVKIFSILFLLLITVFEANNSFCQTTYVDVSGKIADQLRAHGLVNVTKITTNNSTICMNCIPSPNPGQPSLPPQGLPQIMAIKPIQVKITSKEYLTASNIRIASFSDFVWGKDSVTSLPDQYFPTGTTCDNTGGTTPLGCGGSLTLTYQRTSSVSFTQSITHTTSTTIGASGGSPGTFSVSVSATFGESNTTGTTTMDAVARTIQVNKTYNVTVPINSATYTEMRVWTVRHTIPFTCTVIIDADLSENDTGLKSLSDLTPIPDRTFKITGYLIANDCSDAIIKNYPAQISKP